MLTRPKAQKFPGLRSLSPFSPFSDEPAASGQLGTRFHARDNEINVARMRIFPTLLAFVWSLPLAFADSDVIIPKGFEQFYNLEFDQAIAIFRSACKEKPQDPASWNNLAEGLLYSEMLKAGALESELVSGTNSFLRRPKMGMSAGAARDFEAATNKAIELSEASLGKNPRDIHALYAGGLAHGLRANWNFLVRKAWLDALRDATTARKMCNRIPDIDPSFIDARLAQGAHDFLVGSLPWSYRFLGMLAGIHGDREGGIRTIKLVAEKAKYNRYDAQIILAAIYRRERKPDQAIPLLSALIERFPRNYLLRLEMAQMYADLGNKDESLAILQQVENLRKSGSPGYAHLSEERILYYRATTQFWYNDLDQSLENFRRIAPHVERLDLNAAILVWMRIGQICDLKGRRSEAIAAYRQAINLAPQSDAAKEPRGYLSSPYKRLPATS